MIAGEGERRRDGGGAGEEGGMEGGKKEGWRGEKGGGMGRDGERRDGEEWRKRDGRGMEW